jgi:hypothetical protein
LSQIIADAVRRAGRDLQRLLDRPVEKGIHEVRELGPALRDALQACVAPVTRVRLNYQCNIADWTRDRTQVDLVVLGEDLATVEVAAELKAWDIGHQLFDLAKIACLLGSGVSSGFLICVARLPEDFDRMPGGSLFPAGLDETRTHEFERLIANNRSEWSHHVGRSGPEPTAVPSAVTTTSVATDVSFEAYPGHSARAVKVRIVDPTPVPLIDGYPADRESTQPLQ